LFVIGVTPFSFVAYAVLPSGDTATSCTVPPTAIVAPAL
jgi:hypothetical protein